MTKNNYPLDKFTFDGIPPAPRGEPQLEVSFDVDGNGILRVHVCDKISQQHANLRITNEKSCLSQEEVEGMTVEAAWLRETAERKQLQITRFNALQKYVRRLHGFLAADPVASAAVTDDEKMLLTEEIEEALKWMDRHAPRLDGVCSWSEGLEFEAKRADLAREASPVLAKVRRAGADVQAFHVDSPARDSVCSAAAILRSLDAVCGCVPQTAQPPAPPADHGIPPTNNYEDADMLRAFASRGDVALLKASAFASLLADGKLASLDRQALESAHPEAFADAALVERCLREVEVAARHNHCTYPGLFVYSYSWKTKRHPDPSGSLGREASRQLHWYAAQRARWTEQRLYRGGVAAYASNCVAEWEFDAEFVVFMDFWSLHQGDRTQAQTEAFARALGCMHNWYGHRGTTVALVRDVPADWLGDPDSEYAARGGYDSRGWTFYERSVAGLGKAAGLVLDMRSFKEGVASQERLDGKFEGAKLSELRALAMPDAGGFVVEGSCLWGLARAEHPPIPAAMMASELGRKSFSVPSDQGVCERQYEMVLTEILRGQTTLSFKRRTMWPAQDWRCVGSVMDLCINLEELDLNGSDMADEGLIAFAESLGARGWHSGVLPKLKKVNLNHNGVESAGLKALGVAIAKGVMPRLHSIDVDVSSEAALSDMFAAITALEGVEVSYPHWSKVVTIERDHLKRLLIFRPCKEPDSKQTESSGGGAQHSLGMGGPGQGMGGPGQGMGGQGHGMGGGDPGTAGPILLQ